MRVKGANEARRAEGASRAAGQRSARTRRGEEEKDAQVCKLRELAERVWNGAVDLVVAQVPANVSAEGVRGGSAVSERVGTTRVKGANEARRAKGASRLRSGAARGRGAGRRRETHKMLSSVICPTSIGMVPLIFSFHKNLRVCAAWKEGRDMWKVRSARRCRAGIRERRRGRRRCGEDA